MSDQNIARFRALIADSLCVLDRARKLLGEEQVRIILDAADIVHCADQSIVEDVRREMQLPRSVSSAKRPQEAHHGSIRD